MNFIVKIVLSCLFIFLLSLKASAETLKEGCFVCNSRVVLVDFNTALAEKNTPLINYLIRNNLCCQTKKEADVLVLRIIWGSAKIGVYKNKEILWTNIENIQF